MDFFDAAAKPAKQTKMSPKGQILLDEIFSKLKSPLTKENKLQRDISKSPKSGSPDKKFDFNDDWTNDENLLMIDEVQPEYP